MAGEVTVEATEADYVAANRDWLRLYLTSRWAWRRRMLSVGAVTLASGWVGLTEYGILEGALAAAAGFLAMGLLLLTVYALALWHFPRRAARLYRQHKPMREDFHYRWSDEGLTLTTAKSSGRYAWSDFHQWGAGRSAVLLLFNDNLFFFLPRHVLGEEGAADLIGTLERSGVPKR